MYINYIYYMNVHLYNWIDWVTKIFIFYVIIKTKYEVSDFGENMDEERKIKFEKFINNRVERLVAQRTYNWKPIDYSNKYVCHQYLLSRIAPEYNVIKTIFSELKQRDPNFAPQSLFDFGSGIGTVTLYVSFTISLRKTLA